MRPITKFILTTVDELVIFAIILYFASLYFPEYVLYIVVIGAVGIVTFTIAKYKVVRIALEDTHYSYDVVGKRGVVIKRIAPMGKIRIGNEIWAALSMNSDEVIEEGTYVIVVKRKGHKVWVKKAESKSL